MSIRLKGWWNVYTEHNSERGDDLFIGTYYGYVDVLAFALADKQRGFWSVGKLIFKKTEPPRKLSLKPKRETVNIEIEDDKWDNCKGSQEIYAAKKIFNRRPVIVESCNLYNAVTLRRKGKKK